KGKSSGIIANAHHIPVVFTAVTDPIAAKLVTSLEKPGNGVTGVSCAINPRKQVPFIRFLLPYTKTLGIVYNPGEVNSVTSVGSLKAACALEHIQIVEVVANKTSEVPVAVKSLVGKIDAL